VDEEKFHDVTVRDGGGFTHTFCYRSKSPAEARAIFGKRCRKQGKSTLRMKILEVVEVDKPSDPKHIANN
jgi:hypothetical protein